MWSDRVQEIQQHEDDIERMQNSSDALSREIYELTTQLRNCGLRKTMFPELYNRPPTPHCDRLLAALLFRYLFTVKFMHVVHNTPKAHHTKHR